MTDLNLIKQGAEARIYTCTYLNKPCIVKERFVKTYRHPDLDNLLTKERMKHESRAISKCLDLGIKAPTLYLVDFYRRRIYMEYFENGITLKDFIIDKLQPNFEKFKNGTQVLEEIAMKIGGIIRKMHDNRIIHGDLTSSNILLIAKDENLESFKDCEIAMIDFGLSKLDASAEDKGVDLYVLERAILSTHNDLPDLFNVILKGYTNDVKDKSLKKKLDEVLKKFEEVRARGRKRTMIG